MCYNVYKCFYAYGGMFVFTIINVICVVTVLFIAMIVQLAAKPSFSAKLTGTLIVITGIGGLLFYGYGFAILAPDTPTAIVRALYATFGTFMGRSDFSVVSGTPLSQYPIFTFLFWVVHLCALYATASATIISLGAEALKKLRLWLVRRGNLCIIYGANEDSVEFGKALLLKDRCNVLYVDPNPVPSCQNAILKNGCVLRTDKNATRADVQFAKSIGIRAGKRKISLYALDKDGINNLRFASNLLKTFQQLEIAPEQTHLMIMGTQDSAAVSMQTLGEKYGYGFVTVFQEADLVSRMLIQKYPPCNTISFDENGCAQEDLEALIIGFGQIGQSVLRSLVMNSQFVGSKFHCTVFAPNCTSVQGFLTNTCQELMPHYDITLQPHDARSSQMYEYLRTHGKKLKYVTVCTSNAKLNREITDDLLQFFQRLGCDVPVYQCNYSGILRSTASSLLTDETKLYTPELLSYDMVDRMAMGVNHFYMAGNGKTALQNWMDCDYFSRMSSRASADFFPAMMKAAGVTRQEVLDGQWKPEGQLLENLSITEHERWCAFHYCMGYSPMTEEEFQARATQYRKDIADSNPRPIRIAKNAAGRTHACLVPWDALDALSQKENAITGKNVDYKLMDTRNVLAIPQILQSCEDTEVGK